MARISVGTGVNGDECNEAGTKATCLTSSGTKALVRSCVIWVSCAVSRISPVEVGGDWIKPFLFNSKASR